MLSGTTVTGGVGEVEVPCSVLQPTDGCARHYGTYRYDDATGGLRAMWRPPTYP